MTSKLPPIEDVARKVAETTPDYHVPENIDTLEEEAKEAEAQAANETANAEQVDPDSDNQTYERTISVKDAREIAERAKNALREQYRDLIPTSAPIVIHAVEAPGTVTYDVLGTDTPRLTDELTPQARAEILPMVTDALESACPAEYPNWTDDRHIIRLDGVYAPTTVRFDLSRDLREDAERRR